MTPKTNGLREILDAFAENLEIDCKHSGYIQAEAEITALFSKQCMGEEGAFGIVINGKWTRVAELPENIRKLIREEFFAGKEKQTPKQETMNEEEIEKIVYRIYDPENLDWINKLAKELSGKIPKLQGVEWEKVLPKKKVVLLSKPETAINIIYNQAIDDCKQALQAGEKEAKCIDCTIQIKPQEKGRNCEICRKPTTGYLCNGCEEKGWEATYTIKKGR
jgi:hypothetical protein